MKGASGTPPRRRHLCIFINALNAWKVNVRAGCRNSGGRLCAMSGLAVASLPIEPRQAVFLSFPFGLISPGLPSSASRITFSMRLSFSFDVIFRPNASRT